MESHQAGKVDTSGTAKAVISCFQKLGVSFESDQVRYIGYFCISTKKFPVKIEEVGNMYPFLFDD